VNLRVAASLLLVPVAIAAGVATGLATANSAPPRGVRSAHFVAPRHVSVASTPSVSVSPSTGLVGSEQLRVVLSDFPAKVGVQVSECPSAQEVGRSGCAGQGTWLVTDASGSATGTFVAEPTAQAKGTEPLTVCTTQCVVAALESQKFVKPISAAPAAATASVTFQPGGTAGLADAELVQLSWVSPEVGFALARRPCDQGTCAVVARTTNGGASWTELPPLPPTPAFCTTAQCVSGVSGIAFASPTVGYLYGPAMLVTTDGGGSWQVLAGPRVESLAVGGGQVFRIVYTHGGCPGACTPLLQAAPVGSTTWRTVLSDLGYGVGNDLIVSGRDVYVETYGNLASGAGTQRTTISRSTDGGAVFQTLRDPCVGKLATLHVLSALAAAPGGVLEGICSQRAGAGEQYLISSTDAGSTWQPLRPLPTRTNGSFGVVAAASTSTIAIATGPVGGAGTETAKLLVTTDGGASWTTAATDTFELGTVPVAQLGFVTSRVGWWVADLRSVFSTSDGGLDWAQFPFASVPALQTHTPRVVVTPSTDLTNGQTVKVSVTGFGAGGKFYLSECASAADANPKGCGPPLGLFGVTNTTGTGSHAFTVSSTAPTRPYTTPSTLPCTDQCVIVATVGIGYGYAYAPITFAGR